MKPHPVLVFSGDGIGELLIEAGKSRSVLYPATINKQVVSTGAPVLPTSVCIPDTHPLLHVVPATIIYKVPSVHGHILVLLLMNVPFANITGTLCSLSFLLLPHQFSLALPHLNSSWV